MVNMACSEGNSLKHEVLDKIEAYLAAEQAQFTSVRFDQEFSRECTEMAHATLAEARRRYWDHIRYHRCDTAAIVSLEMGPVPAHVV